MSVTNINLLPEINAEYSEFLIQSLANLGQRLGVKGDSIQAGSFVFKDILGESYSTYSPDSTVGVIERENGILKIYIASKKTLIPIRTPEYVTEYQNTLVFDTTKEFESSIDGINYYKANSYITTLKNNRYVFCGIGQNQNREDLEFIYEEYDKSSNNLLSGLRIAEYDGKTLCVTFNTVSNDSADVEIFTINDKLSNILSKIENRIQSLYKTKESAFGVINESKIKSISVDYWINYLRLNRYGSNYKKYEKIPYVIGEESTQLIFDIDVVEKELIYLFHYDKRDKLPKLKEYFTTEVYNLNKYSFKKQILYSLFNKIYVNNPYNCKLYIPVDFVFNYYCNSNDQWKIYGGIQDIHVRFIKSGSLNRGNFDYYYKNDQWIGFIDDDENQSALYNYSVEYSDDNKFIYSVCVNRKYSLPYVNKNDLWVIDDEITNIKASGKDAGNPNIIIVYSFTNNFENPQEGIDYKILSSFDETTINKIVSTWKLTSVNIEPIEKINLENPSILTISNLYRIGCYVPDINNLEDNVERNNIISKLENALIINISSVNCFDKIDDRIINTYGEEGVVTTLWKLNSNGSKFEVIQNPKFDKTLGSVALDIVHLTNLNNLVKWHIMNHEPKHPDRYTNSWLVFDNAKKETKNLINDYRSYVYPVMSNKSADEYYSSNYANDFNFTIKYFDMINGAEEQNIQNIGHSANKFITASNYSVTNTLYNRRLESNSIFKNFEEYIPNTDMPIFDLSEMLVKDQNILNRTNIITFSESGDVFYSYVGTSFTDPDKNRVHFGSSNININLGTDTMVSTDIQEDIFKKQTELDIDFEVTKINGYSYVLKDLEVGNDIRTGHINWTVRKMKDKTIYSTTFIPTSKLMIQNNRGEKILDFMKIVQFNNTNFITDQIKKYYNGSLDSVMLSNKFDCKLWIPSFYLINKSSLFKRSKMIYFGELLYLPTLLGRLDLRKYVSNPLKIASVKSNMKIIRYGNVPLMFVTSNKFLQDLDYGYNEVNSEISFTLNSDEIFTGNSLEISYYIDQSDNLHLTVNEFNNSQNIDNLFRLKLNYY